ncbi:MAG: zinc ABC transporter substrate-binding protein, partial [Spirochaetaceae bacterium]|nr:zinc ABC transporter substrate-binding protein [Spirochaetaceae bacterium]
DQLHNRSPGRIDNNFDIRSSVFNISYSKKDYPVETHGRASLQDFVFKEHKMIKPRHFASPHILILVLLISAIIIPLTGCTPKTKKTNKGIQVFVSIEPQRYFVERIGGQYIHAEVMVKPGQNPATYDPTPLQITKLGNSQIFFIIGVPFEKSFISKIKSSLPNLKIVDTSRGIVKRVMKEHESDELSKDSKNEQLDPHIWMSPVLVKKQALIILNALIKIDPDHSKDYKSNYNLFIDDLDNLDLELKKTLANLKDGIIFVYHPSFGYFADAYNLKQLAIESAGKEPGPKNLESIITEITTNHVKVIFVQPEFQSSSIQVITKATGAAVMAVDPLSYDYLKNLQYIADTLKDNIQP